MINSTDVKSGAIKTIVSTLTIGGILILSSRLYRKRKKKNRPWPKVPDALPLIGNMLPGGLDNIADALESWADQYGPTGVYEFKLFGQRMVVICNEEKMKYISTRRPYQIIKAQNLRNAINSSGSDGLFSAEGSQWRKDRKLISPFLNRKNVRDYVSFVKLISSRLVEKWERIMSRDGFVSINSDLISAGIDIIGLVGFSKDIDSVRADNSIMGSDVKLIMQKVMMRALLPIPFWKIPLIGQYIDGLGWARKRMISTICEIVEEQKEGIPKKETPKDILAKLITQHQNEGSAMDNNRLIGNLLTFFFAGSETTASTITSCLYALATDHTGLQDELARECTSLPEIQTVEDLLDCLPRLRSFLYETLRMLGPAPFMLLEPSASFEIDGVNIDAKTPIIPLTRFISMKQESRGSATIPRGPLDAPARKFCARRWLVEGNEGISVQNYSSSRGFRAFGDGLRICPGRDLAEVEALYILTSIIRRFKIDLKENHAVVKFVTRITYCTDIDIHLKLNPRKKLR